MIPNVKGYDFDSYLPTKYWNDKTRIEYIQRRIIVYSIMYYELNESCITDKQYDCISRQLIEYMNTTDKSILEQTQYYYCMYDFDGNTGYDLYYRLNEKDKMYLFNMCKNILNKYKYGGKQ